MWCWLRTWFSTTPSIGSPSLCCTWTVTAVGPPTEFCTRSQTAPCCRTRSPTSRLYHMFFGSLMFLLKKFIQSKLWRRSFAYLRLVNWYLKHYEWNVSRCKHFHEARRNTFTDLYFCLKVLRKKGIVGNSQPTELNKIEKILVESLR